jgi:hypothetical protein
MAPRELTPAHGGTIPRRGRTQRRELVTRGRRGHEIGCRRSRRAPNNARRCLGGAGDPASEDARRRDYRTRLSDDRTPGGVRCRIGVAIDPPERAFGTCSVSQNKASTRYSVTQKDDRTAVRRGLAGRRRVPNHLDRSASLPAIEDAVGRVFRTRGSDGSAAGPTRGGIMSDTGEEEDDEVKRPQA